MGTPQKRATPSAPETNGIDVKAPVSPEFAEILSPPALQFLKALSRKFESTRQELLKRREARQQEIDAGRMPDFLRETAEVRASDWQVSPIPKDLVERKVEITGPVERKMMVNALNSGANVFMADFEDSHSPTWVNTLQGQLNVRDAVRRSITFTSPEGKFYQLNAKTATLLTRPRGWHLVEKHVLVDGQPISASLFDFGLAFFHNAEELLKRGTGPYYYLPKLESHLEARLWRDVFHFSEQSLGIPKGSIRATVLIETILAAFEMHEILFELREYCCGLNCGRWDYIFSFIKKFSKKREFLLPDRAQVTMDRAFLKAYVDLLIQTCHRRGAYAMGGMAAQIPIKSDATANAAALEHVRLDKLREVRAGHDGTWVAHPGLVEVALKTFNEHLRGAHQLSARRDDVRIGPQDLLAVPSGDITEKGLRTNINVGIQYLESWLRGTGCVPINHLMEDAATVEISRTQVWQWVRHGATLAGGGAISPALVKKTIGQELEAIASAIGADRFKSGPFELASKLFEEIATGPECPEFLTLVAYEYLD